MTSHDMPSEQMLVPREQLPLPRPFVASRTPTEKTLAEIWRTALSMDRVGVNDSYNDLGGDSLHASIIFTMIQDTFRIALPMAVLANASTIAELAPMIDRLIAGK
jgi:acyl carrier protein